MRRNLFERDEQLGLKKTPGDRKKELRDVSSELVELVFHLLDPHTVALFVPDKRDVRLAAIKSLEEDVVPPGFRLSLSDTFFPSMIEEIGDLWIRELADGAHRLIPIYPGDTAIHSLRFIPVPVDSDKSFTLMIDYTDVQERDPLEIIAPLLDLFSQSTHCTNESLCLSRGPVNVPIPVFLRRILKLFIDLTLDIEQIESLGLVLWGPPASEGKILEMIGERLPGSTRRPTQSFDLGPFRFFWSMGGLRKLSAHSKESEQGARYYPLTVGGDVVGNLSIASDDPEFEFHESLVRVISWSIQRELKLIRELIMGRIGIGMPNSNPYRAVIRVLDEWSNASRYNEYLSLGLVRLRLEGAEDRVEPWEDGDCVDRNLWIEVEDVLRTGDILAHCMGGKMTLIFPRTSPEGAEKALRRLRNLLEGKKISVNGSSIRIASAEYTVLCYPRDLPTKEIVLEKCSLVFLPE